MRISTVPMQGVLANAIQKNLEKVATLQRQVATGKTANSFADLGPEAVRTVATRTVAARESAYVAAAQRTSATLGIYDAQLTGLYDTASSFKETLLNAVGTGNANGIEPQMQALFGQARATLNAREGGRLLFAGTATDSEPFTVSSVADLTALPSAADAFANDSGRASVRLSDGMAMTYGLHADETGLKVAEAIRKVAAAGIPASGRLTASQITAVQDAIGVLDQGLKDVQAVQASNGRRQQDVETAGDNAKARNTLLTKIVSDVEDADYATVAAKLIATQTALQASYTIFSQSREMSLVNFLR